MRRLLLWTLPVAAAVLATIIFATGFVEFIHGDIGSRVSVSARAIDASAPKAILAPLVLGDSLARGAGDQSGLGVGGRLVEELQRRHIATKPATNLAINGARTRDLIAQLKSHNVQAVIAQSNLIVVSIGGNDLWGDNNWRAGPPRNPELVMGEVLDRVATIIGQIRAANPTARIFIVGLYNPFAKERFGPMLTIYVKRWNSLLAERFASDPRIDIVDTFDIFAYRDRLSFDHFHPADEGYALIARRIADAV